MLTYNKIDELINIAQCEQNYSSALIAMIEQYTEENTLLAAYLDEFKKFHHMFITSIPQLLLEKKEAFGYVATSRTIIIDEEYASKLEGNCQNLLATFEKKHANLIDKLNQQFSINDTPAIDELEKVNPFHEDLLPPDYKNIPQKIWRSARAQFMARLNEALDQFRELIASRFDLYFQQEKKYTSKFHANIFKGGYMLSIARVDQTLNIVDAQQEYAMQLIVHMENYIKNNPKHMSANEKEHLIECVKNFREFGKQFFLDIQLLRVNKSTADFMALEEIESQGMSLIEKFKNEHRIFIKALDVIIADYISRQRPMLEFLINDFLNINAGILENGAICSLKDHLQWFAKISPLIHKIDMMDPFATTLRPPEYAKFPERNWPNLRREYIERFNTQMHDYKNMIIRSSMNRLISSEEIYHEIISYMTANKKPYPGKIANEKHPTHIHSYISLGLFEPADIKFKKVLESLKKHADFFLAPFEMPLQFQEWAKKNEAAISPLSITLQECLPNEMRRQSFATALRIYSQKNSDNMLREVLLNPLNARLIENIFILLGTAKECSLQTIYDKWKVAAQEYLMQPAL